MAIGENEVQITNVWTVEATHEYGTEHDDTPNVKEDQAPNPLASSFHLRIQAEAGRTLGHSSWGYHLVIQPVCLTMPFAGMIFNMNPGPFLEAFGGPTAWEYQAHEEMYTRGWTIPLPTPVGLFPVERGQTWQYIVSLVDTTGPGGSIRFVCTFASKPFVLL